MEKANSILEQLHKEGKYCNYPIVPLPNNSLTQLTHLYYWTKQGIEDCNYDTKFIIKQKSFKRSDLLARIKKMDDATVQSILESFGDVTLNNILGEDQLFEVVDNIMSYNLSRDEMLPIPTIIPTTLVLPTYDFTRYTERGIPKITTRPEVRHGSPYTGEIDYSSIKKSLGLEKLWLPSRPNFHLMLFVNLLQTEGYDVFTLMQDPASNLGNLLNKKNIANSKHEYIGFQEFRSEIPYLKGDISPSRSILDIYMDGATPTVMDLAPLKLGSNFETPNSSNLNIPLRPQTLTSNGIVDPGTASILKVNPWNNFNKFEVTGKNLRKVAETKPTAVYDLDVHNISWCSGFDSFIREVLVLKLNYKPTDVDKFKNIIYKGGDLLQVTVASALLDFFGDNDIVSTEALYSLVAGRITTCPQTLPKGNFELLENIKCPSTEKFKDHANLNHLIKVISRLDLDQIRLIVAQRKVNLILLINHIRTYWKQLNDRERIVLAVFMLKFQLPSNIIDECNNIISKFVYTPPSEVDIEKIPPHFSLGPTRSFYNSEVYANVKYPIYDIRFIELNDEVSKHPSIQGNMTNVPEFIPTIRGNLVPIKKV